MGVLDANMDGKIEKAELKPESQIGAMLLKNWDAMDKNHDGVIDKDELAAAMKMMGGGRRRQEQAQAAPAAPAPTGGK
jgi:Ca2+-binding EF-hand superfamily protein